MVVKTAWTKLNIQFSHLINLKPKFLDENSSRKLFFLFVDTVNFPCWVVYSFCSVKEKPKTGPALSQIFAGPIFAGPNICWTNFGWANYSSDNYGWVKYFLGQLLPGQILAGPILARLIMTGSIMAGSIMAGSNIYWANNRSVNYGWVKYSWANNRSVNYGWANYDQLWPGQILAGANYGCAKYLLDKFCPGQILANYVWVSFGWAKYFLGQLLPGQILARLIMARPIKTR